MFNRNVTMNKIVKNKFRSYPENIKPRMEILRRLILDVAKNTEGVGEIEETLKWGEPAYLTSKSKSGTTIRIDWKSKNPSKIAMYVSCNTTLINTFKNIIGNALQYEGNRAILFSAEKDFPEEELKLFIKMALRYHLDKNKLSPK